MAKAKAVRSLLMFVETREEQMARIIRDCRADPAIQHLAHVLIWSDQDRDHDTPRRRQWHKQHPTVAERQEEGRRADGSLRRRILPRLREAGLTRPADRDRALEAIYTALVAWAQNNEAAAARGGVLGGEARRRQRAGPRTLPLLEAEAVPAAAARPAGPRKPAQDHPWRRGGRTRTEGPTTADLARVRADEARLARDLRPLDEWTALASAADDDLGLE